MTKSLFVTCLVLIAASTCIQARSFRYLQDMAANFESPLLGNAESNILDRGEENVEEAAAAATYPSLKQTLHAMGIYFHSGDVNKQFIANLYCSQVRADFIQCVMYDSNNTDAQLIAVEYVVPRATFETFSEDEKKAWHSHNFAGVSGIAAAPEVPADQQNGLWASFINSYGKTVYLLGEDGAFLHGDPQYLFELTDMSQVNMDLVNELDAQVGSSYVDRAASRAGLVSDPIVAGVPDWLVSGQAIRLQRTFVPNINFVATSTEEAVGTMEEQTEM